MHADPPHRAYYRSVEGRWRGTLDFAITDWAALRAAPMARIDRLRLIGMALASRVVGPSRLDTSVDASGDEVVHTTRVSKWGVTVMRSTERLALDPNGRDLTMRILLGLAPAPWRVRALPPAPARVDDTATRVSYRIPWFGGEMRQEAERGAEGNTVTLLQETAYSRGVQVLRRR
ncbi:MAG: hypothetical protein U0802_23750 [Candidatus Binatia bacterium]